MSTYDSFTVYGDRDYLRWFCRRLLSWGNRFFLCHKTENINETLDYLLTKYPKGKVAKRLRASKDYLKHSHYKDYETALYRYLSDNDTENVITEILILDLQKIRRLPCKEETE